MAYAENTKVPISRTKEHIEAEVMKRKGTSFGILQELDRAMVFFAVSDRRVRFELRFKKGASDREIRSRWRALYLVVKAKLESVDAGIETIEEAFLAQVVMPDGMTVYEHAQEPLRLAYTSGKGVPLLPAPK